MFPFPFSLFSSLAPDPLAQVNNVYSMEFDGDDKINCGSATSYDNFTLSVWVNKDSLAPDYAGIFGTRNTPTSPIIFPHLLSLDTGGYIRLIADGAIKVLSNSALANNTWYHVVGVGDGTNLKLYIDGILQNDVKNYTTPLPSATNDLMIGAQWNTDTQYPWVGKIDEAAIFDTALTAQEVQSIYNATAIVSGVSKTADLSQLTTPPIKWYRMGD
tara:strand:+ start:25 stop:669 length:645 start_codon:yes stop_codon:yes gene_type:complete